ncbi:MAG: MATE family efflux transporter [Gammaproteobacteria bacterium]
MKISENLNLQDKTPGAQPWLNVVNMVALRAFGVLLQFALNIFIARVFGPAGIGFYQLYNSWMVTIADTGGCGLPVSTMRGVSQRYSTGDKRSAGDFIKKTLLLTAGIFTILVVAGVTLIPWWLGTMYPGRILPYFFFFALAGSLFFALFRILIEASKAEGRAKISVTFESIVLPFLFFIAIIAYVLFSDSPNVTTLVLIHVGALAVITMVFYLLWSQNQEPSYRKSGVPDRQRILQPDGFAIWGGVVANVLIINLPFYLLPLITDPESIGIFSVNYRIVAVATTLLVVLSAWFGPRIAAAHSRRDANRVRQELKQARIFSALVYLPFLLVCMLFGQQVLAIFGEAFIDSGDILMILAAGQLVNALTGMPGLHLNMIGKSRLELYMALVALTIGMPLCLIGGISFGMVGLAAGFSLTIALKNLGSLLLSEIQLRKKADTRINTELCSLGFQAR